MSDAEDTPPRKSRRRREPADAAGAADATRAADAARTGNLPAGEAPAHDDPDAASAPPATSASHAAPADEQIPVSIDASEARPEPAAATMGAGLDRAFELRGASWLMLGWIVALAGAAALRLGDLDRWALSPAEGAAAFDAWRMYTGNPGVPGEALPAATPTPLLLGALSYFLFGVTDATFRLPGALAGIGMLGLAWLLRGSVGRAAACGMAVVAAFSPLLVQGARTGDGQTIAAAMLLAAAVAVLRLGEDGLGAGAARRWAVLGGIALALAIGCGAGGILSLVALAAALGMAGTRPGAVRSGLRRLAARETAIPAAAALIATLILLFTRLFTAPEALAGIPRALGDAAALAAQPGPSRLGIMALLMLLLYEPVAALLAGYELWAQPEDGRDRSPVNLFALWLAAGMVIWGLAAGAGPEHMVHLALPLALVAGAGLARLLGLIDWSDVRAGRGAALLAAILAASAAAFAVIVLLGRNPMAPDRVAAAAPAIGVAMLALVPLLYVVSRLAGAEREAGLPRQTGRLALLALALMLGAFGLSSATHLIYERAGTGKEPAAQFVSTGAVRPTVDRLGRLARDVGVTDGSVRDEEGGHALRVAIDERTAQPWRWYLREFPFAGPVAAGTGGAAAADAVIAPAEETAPEGYAGEVIPAITGVPDVYLNPDLPDLLKRIALPERWLADARFLHFREGVFVPPPAGVRLSLNRALTGKAETAAETGPLTLDDRAGAGLREGQFLAPVGIATAPDGTIYVMDAGNARVQAFTPEGDFAGLWDGTTGVSLMRTDTGFGPTGITVGPDGNVYLADTWNHRVLVVSPAGQVLRQLGGQNGDTTDDPARVEDMPGMFFGPRAVAVGNDAIYVADTGNERIQVFSTDGTFMRAFGGYGTAEGNLIEPVGLAIGPDGDLYVADSGNRRISVFSPKGAFRRAFTVEAWPPPDPSGLRPFFQPYLAFDRAGRLFASSSDSGTVEVYDPVSGALLGSVDGGGGDVFSQPIGVAVAGDGDLLVTDTGANAVIRAPAAGLPGAAAG